tara:strand:+ start:2984 stop:3421 length:438 start_codon:yes stop_codon:yes gene_type:complete
MGLDMYLRGDKFITTFDDTKRDKDGKALRVKRPVVDGFDVETHVLDLGTWRKFAPLHVYIVNEFADGVDECQRIDLSAGELRKIAKALRNNKLPKNDDCHGCFFGDDEWWDELKSEGEKHAKVFDKAAEWVESTFWNNVTYQASW